MKLSALIPAFILSITLNISDVNGSEDVDKVIKYLLDYVRKSDVIFIRNGKEHNPQAAAEHMERKLEHFRDEIETPEDFIRLTGTKSILSGKPYLVRFLDGEEIRSKEWLEKALEQYRE
jgi:hypothetical protein